jgi:hypothetical protein
MARAKSCTWKGTAARGVYKPACSITKVLGIPPRPGTECPGCGRPVVHYRPKQKSGGMADFLKWKKRRVANASEGQS